MFPTLVVFFLSEVWENGKGGTCGHGPWCQALGIGILALSLLSHVGRTISSGSMPQSPHLCNGAIIKPLLDSNCEDQASS